MIDHPAERARDFARADADWSWEADADLRLTWVCDRFAAATGIAPHAALGRSPFASGDPASLVDRPAAFQGIPAAFSRDGASYALSGAPRFADDGSVSGYRGTASRRIAGSDIDVRSNFLSSVSHEFRTPLNAIIGFAEAMEGELHGPLSDRYSSYARDIAQAGRHLLDLIGDILDASAIEQGNALIEVSRLSVGSVVAKAVSIVSINAEDRHVEIVQRPVGEGLRLLADERRFCQILVNLMGNAIKFTPAGGRVEISAHALDDARVAIEVSDDGPGIAAEDQQRIFEKFERLQADPFIRRDGAGLGLAISRDLALLMNGTLGVDSVPGEGARFTLTLPAV